MTMLGERWWSEHPGERIEGWSRPERQGHPAADERPRPSLFRWLKGGMGHSDWFPSRAPLCVTKSPPTISRDRIASVGTSNSTARAGPCPALLFLISRPLDPKY